MDSCGGITVLVEYFTRESSLQHHLCAFREDEMVKQAGGGGCLVEPQFLQGGEADPFPGRSDGLMKRIEGNFDVFE